jgi:uncharacterized membrane protein YfcA
VPSTSQSTATSPGRSRKGARRAATRRSGAVTATDPSSGAPDAAGTPWAPSRVVRLAAIGLVAGLFSTLFGVGGGIIMVPLLIVLLAYDAKAATATSLAAIVFTATFGTIAHGALGNVDWTTALLIGIPAVAGVNIGLAIKARVSSRALTYAFAAVLVAVAVVLAVG